MTDDLIRWLIERCPIFAVLDQPDIRDAYRELTTAYSFEWQAMWAEILHMRIEAVLTECCDTALETADAISLPSGIIAQHQHDNEDAPSGSSK